MSALFAWIAVRFRRTGTALVAGIVIAFAVLGALVGIKRKAERKGQREEREKNERDQLRQAVQEGEDYAETIDAMRDASSAGPRSRDDVLERMRNAKDD